MSILMFAEDYDFNQPDYFHDLSKDISNKDIEFCKKEKKLLNTEKAKEICERKIKFIENFIEQLKYETGNSYDILQALT